MNKGITPEYMKKAADELRKGVSDLIESGADPIRDERIRTLRDKHVAAHLPPGWRIVRAGFQTPSRLIVTCDPDPDDNQE